MLCSDMKIMWDIFLLAANYLKCCRMAVKVNNSLNHSKLEVRTIFSVVFLLSSLACQQAGEVSNCVYVSSIMCRKVYKFCF